MKPRRPLIFWNLYSGGCRIEEKNKNNTFQVIRRALRGIKLRNVIDDLVVGKGEDCFRWDGKSVGGRGIKI